MTAEICSGKSNLVQTSDAYAQFGDGSGTRYDGKKIDRDLRWYLREHQIV